MACRLCLADAKLCRSHIFPELMYKPVYDQSGRISSVWTDTADVAWLQKGLRELLLCSACETRLSALETRRYLVSEDPRSAHEYGCAMVAILGASNMPESLIVFPKALRLQGIICYMFMAMGFCWWYPMRTKNLPADFTDLFLKEGGTMLVPIRAYADLPLKVRAGHDLAVELRRKHAEEGGPTTG